ncbi:hypothetical protein [Armatimonas sp.]|uniref:hypothetical protein n=1 Tax=Armatimonas sp. TaxID=1872638 RepID=UPI00286D45D5|nr:hypothetical protein [Armatimonas sp.]
MKISVLAGFFICAVAVIGVLSAPESAHAATITVSTAGLQEAYNSGNYTVDGDCTLREAIKAANTNAAVDACAAGSGSDTIVLPAGTYDITNADNASNGLPQITTNITITGAGRDTTIIRRANDALSGDRGSTAPLFRLFQVSTAGSLSLSGITIRGGYVQLAEYGGGILNDGTLSVSSVDFRSNSYVNAAGDHGGGGGIHTVLAASATTIVNSRFIGNTSTYMGSGLYCQRGSLNVSGSEFASNTGTAVGLGHWSLALGCQATISGSSIHGSTNQAAGGFVPNGAAINVDNWGYGALNGSTNRLTLSTSEIYSNTGLYAVYCYARACNLTDNIIHDNTAIGYAAGGTSEASGVSRTSFYGNTRAIGASSPTLNDTGDATLPINFPVLTRSEIVGATFEVEGFARPGARVELYVAEVGGGSFAGGQTYLTSKTEGSADDLDATTGSYGPSAVNGVVVGSDTTNKFTFHIPISSLSSSVLPGQSVTSSATLSAGTSEFGNSGTATGLSTAQLAALAFSCNKAVAGSTTTCSASLPSGATLPTGGIQVAAGTTPGGTCTVASGTLTCADVPTAATRGVASVVAKIASDASATTSAQATVTSPLATADLSALASTAGVACTPNTAKTKTTCTGALPSTFTASARLTMGFEGETAVDCSFSGGNFACADIPVPSGKLISKAGGSLWDRLAHFFAPKAFAADGASLIASVDGGTATSIGLTVALADIPAATPTPTPTATPAISATPTPVATPEASADTAPTLARTGDDAAPVSLAAGLLLVLCLWVRRRVGDK